MTGLQGQKGEKGGQVWMLIYISKFLAHDDDFPAFWLVP